MRPIPVFGILTTLVFSSESDYRRELRYLDYYLGVKPLNNGHLAIKESALHRYISNSTELDCYLNDSCAWENAKSDGLLDTSDFYLFIRTDEKPFPIQIQPGDPNPPPGNTLNLATFEANGTQFPTKSKINGVVLYALMISPSLPEHSGSLFLLAGNATSAAQSAIFVSAPVACQRSQSRFSFKNDICHVVIPEMNEPFRIGIRAFRLQDESLGSFAMISDIEYRADVCLQTRFSRIFGGRLVPPVLWHDIAATASEYSCVDFNINCRWSSTLAATSEWRVSNHLKKWDEVIGSRTRPSG
uniref:MAM domain-containing protein n=1 Tax=Parascaris equorum TaxID=6256 RepID=A0A914RKI3_PAREQ